MTRAEKLGVSPSAFPTLVAIFPFSRVSFYKIKELRWKSNRKPYTAISLVLLEVLIEKRNAAISCDANRTKTASKTVEQMNF